MNKLDAVNEMLEAMGEPPVTALDTGGTSIAAEAEATLDREGRRIQTQGWYANTLLEQEYEPNATDEIPLPDVLAIRAVVGGWGKRRRVTDPNLHVAIRDGKLFDLANNSAEFSQAVKLEVVKLIDFTTLPEHIADLIVKTAAVKFQRYKKRGDVDDALARDEQHRAKIHAQQVEGDLESLNLLDSPGIDRVKGRRRNPLL